MIRYVSTRGGIEPVDFDEAVLQGFAADGGLFVPDSIPVVTSQQLSDWQNHSYPELVLEFVSLYIDASIIPREDLKRLIGTSYTTFEHSDVLPLVPLECADGILVLELFNGPTLSFKDVAMGLLMNIVDYFLQERNEHLSILLATTGDTGPAAAHAAAGKSTIDCWPIFPKGKITEEQERQMTTIDSANIHPVGVLNCPDGGDDIDRVVAQLIGDPTLRKRFNLSSVNSINWCRVMIQAVHYFYAYYKAVDKVGAKVAFSVPSGAFGNLFAGTLARSMGLPVERFICANNQNKTLHRAISEGMFLKEELVETLSSAMDIVVPYNFWRFLYYSCGCDAEKVKNWMDEFNSRGKFEMDEETLAAMQAGFESMSVSDGRTLDTVFQTFHGLANYLLDPHTAVAVAAARELKDRLPPQCKVVCMATAHPAKFPDVIRKALKIQGDLPTKAKHGSIEDARQKEVNMSVCECSSLESTLVEQMTQVLSVRQA